jgi:hypothetical protein
MGRGRVAVRDCASGGSPTGIHGSSGIVIESVRQAVTFLQVAYVFGPFMMVRENEGPLNIAVVEGDTLELFRHEYGLNTGYLLLLLTNLTPE